MVRRLLFGVVVVLLPVSLTTTVVTVWWAKTVVTTADRAVLVERENVKAARAYAEAVKTALDKILPLSGTGSLSPRWGRLWVLLWLYSPQVMS